MQTSSKKILPTDVIVYVAVWTAFMAICVVAFYVNIGERADIITSHAGIQAINAERAEEGLAPRELVPWFVFTTYAVQFLAVALVIVTSWRFWRERPWKQPTPTGSASA